MIATDRAWRAAAHDAARLMWDSVCLIGLVIIMVPLSAFSVDIQVELSFRAIDLQQEAGRLVADLERLRRDL